jgi:hypothetical protein
MQEERCEMQERSEMQEELLREPQPTMADTGYTATRLEAGDTQRSTLLG